MIHISLVFTQCPFSVPGYHIFRCVLLGKSKWRKSCSGFRSRRAGLWLCFWICSDSVPAHLQAQQSGNTLDEKGSGSWNSWVPGGLANPPRSKNSCDSQKLWNSFVKLHFLYAIWWWYQFSAWDYRQEPPKLQFEVSPKGGCTAQGAFPNGTPDCC